MKEKLIRLAEQCYALSPGATMGVLEQFENGQLSLNDTFAQLHSIVNDFKSTFAMFGY